MPDRDQLTSFLAFQYTVHIMTTFEEKGSIKTKQILKMLTVWTVGLDLCVAACVSKNMDGATADSMGVCLDVLCVL